MLQHAIASSTAATSGSADEQLPGEDGPVSTTPWFESAPPDDLAVGPVCFWEIGRPAPLAIQLSVWRDGLRDLAGADPALFLQGGDGDGDEDEDGEDDGDDEEEDGNEDDDDIPLDWPDEQDDFEEFDEDDFDDDFDDDFEEEIEEEEFKESKEEFGFSFDDGEEEE